MEIEGHMLTLKSKSDKYKISSDIVSAKSRVEVKRISNILEQRNLCSFVPWSFHSTCKT